MTREAQIAYEREKEHTPIRQHQARIKNETSNQKKDNNKYVKIRSYP